MSPTKVRGLASVLFAVPALLLLLAAAARADVLVVDAAGGPGVDATQISAAVALAADGDVILVRSRRYASFSIVNRSLVVPQDAGAAVIVDGQITVRDLAPGRQVLLRGLTTGTPSGHGVSVERCAGPVWIEACTLRGAVGVGSFGLGGHGVAVQDCAAVTLLRCTSTGGDGGPGPAGIDGTGGSGAYSSNSMLAAHGCTFTGGDGDTGGSGSGGGGSGLWLSSAGFGFAGGCTLTGGDGGVALGTSGCPNPGAGGYGLFALFDAHALTLEGTHVGGAGGTASGLPTCPDGNPGQPVLTAFPSTHTALAGRARSLRIPSPVREGQAVQVILSGDPGDVAWVLASPLQAFLPLPQHHGVLSVPATTTLLFVGAVPGGGQIVLTTALPELPVGFEAAVLYVASAFTGTAEGIVLGSPASLVALDAGL